jgi:hypothetical protein
MLNCHVLLFFSSLRINENSQFADGLGMGSFLRKKVKDVVFNMMENNGEFARRVGYGLATSYLSFDKTFQQQIMNKINTDSEFAKGVRMVLDLTLCLNLVCCMIKILTSMYCFLASSSYQ